MSRQDLRKLVTNFTTLILLSVCLFIASRPQKVWGNWRQAQKSITHTPRRDQPLRIEKVKLAGLEFELKAEAKSKEDFEGGDDWMRGMTVTFKNTSDKNIVYALLFIHLPETAATGQAMAQPISYGRYPKSSEDLKPGDGLKPGEEAEITLTDDEYNSLQALLKTGPLSKVSSLELKLDSVIFDDDLLWFGGIMMRRDPNNPRQWLTISKQ